MWLFLLFVLVAGLTVQRCWCMRAVYVATLCLPSTWQPGKKPRPILAEICLQHRHLMAEIGAVVCSKAHIDFTVRPVFQYVPHIFSTE